MLSTLLCARLEMVPYADALNLQREVSEAREQNRIPDTLLLLEHYPVYTKGRRTQPGELPMGEDWYRMQGIEVAETDRGGLVTYHGPGQLVGYPIISLAPRADDVRAYVRDLETVMIGSLSEVGIRAGVIDGLTGVWAAVEDGEFPDHPTEDSTRTAVVEGALRKIGSIGVHVRRGVTTHGFAINVNADLQPFEWIVPCGIDGCRMTSVAKELGSEQDFGAFTDRVQKRFAEVFAAEAENVSEAELAERVRATDAHS